MTARSRAGAGGAPAVTSAAALAGVERFGGVEQGPRRGDEARGERRSIGRAGTRAGTRAAARRTRGLAQPGVVGAEHRRELRDTALGVEPLDLGDRAAVPFALGDPEVRVGMCCDLG